MKLKNKSILHITPTLGDGGAERTLVNLCCSSVNCKHNILFMKFDDLERHSKYEQILLNQGVNLIPIRIDGIWKSLKSLFSIRSKIKSCNPDLIQGWQYYGNFLTLFSLGMHIPIFWNIRRSDTSLKTLNRKLWIINKVCAVLSYFIPTRIVCCGESAKKNHVLVGYDPSKLIVINNGLPVDRFRFCNEKRQIFRTAHNLSDEVVAIAMLGRYDRAKNYFYSLDILKEIVRENQNIVLFIAGKGMNRDNRIFMKKIYEENLHNYIVLLDQIAEIDLFFSGTDIYLSTSITEGFSNSLIEAMSSSLQCYVTDVGANLEVLTKKEYIIPLDNSIQAAKILLDQIAMKNFGVKANPPFRNYCLARIVDERYNSEIMSENYERTWYNYG